MEMAKKVKFKKDLSFKELLGVNNSKKQEDLKVTKLSLPLVLRRQVAGLKEKHRTSLKTTYLSLCEYGFHLIQAKWGEMLGRLKGHKEVLEKLGNRFLNVFLYDARLTLNHLEDPRPTWIYLTNWMHTEFSEMAEIICSSKDSMIRYSIYLSLKDILNVNTYDADLKAFEKQIEDLRFIIVNLSEST